MTSPYKTGTVTEFPLSGNTTIDAFINWGFKWGAGGVGVGATVTYSFPQAGAEWIGDYYDGEPSSGFQAFNASQQHAARNALTLWQEVANITFVEVAETPTVGPVEGDVGDIRFGFSSVVTNDPYAIAWGYFPYSEPNFEFPEAGDVWFDPAYGPNLQMQPGQFGFSTLIHEIGHAIGLDHPFDDGDGEPVLPAFMDNNQYTIMAYDGHPHPSVTTEAMTPMLLDILAIQYLYGANMTTRTGDDVYTFSNNGAVLKAIWDAGGDDTIDASNQTTWVGIDLRPGSFSSIGRNAGGSVTIDNIAIAYGVTIENANGGSGNDGIQGNDVANRLFGGGGNDDLSGNGGNDTLDGGVGNDRMYGGSGNDTYYVNSAGDVIDEAGNSDVADEIRTTVSINMAVLGAGLVENARAWTSAAINITGNAKGNYILGSIDKNTLDGGGGDDILWGNDGNDVVAGGEGNDYLDGGTGNDTLRGGKGNDIYLIDSANDVIDEQGSTDTGDDVRGYFSFNLNTLGGGAVDRAILFGSADLNATGNARANRLAGNSGANVLDGGGGDDLLLGGAGSDILIGGGGNDWLSGDDGIDVFKGGSGNDSYVVDSLTEIVDEESNTDSGDQVRATFTVDLETYAGGQIETAVINGGDSLDAYGSAAANLLWGNDAANTLDGRGGDDTLIGNGGDDTLIGGQGNDWIDGGTGNDEMKGGSGNDRYIVDSTDDVVDEEGNADTGDEVRATVSVDISLLGGGAIENIVLQGAGAIDATGNAGANKIYGNSSNNILDGGLGDDILLGGAGNDVYIVDSFADVIDEQGSKDTSDEIRTSAFSIVLAGIGAGAIENATVLGGGDLDITGTGANNRLVGNSGTNTLIGANGNDYLDGGGGDDVMKGGSGNDFYVVGSLNDIVDEQGSLDSSDGISVTFSVDLSIFANGAIENAVAQAGFAISLGGNNAANTLTGNAEANVIAGGGGNDIIYGEGGLDQLSGGEGNDRIVISSISGVTVDGGTGTDTLQLIGASEFDLTLISSDAIKGIEAIDLGGGGSSKLTVSAQDVADLSDTSSSLYITGDLGDSVQFTNAPALAGTTSIGGVTYSKYGYGTSTVYVEWDVTVFTKAPVVPTSVLNLGTLNGIWGARIEHNAVNTSFGTRLASIGDINQDGFQDVLLADGQKNYLLYGQASAFGHPTSATDPVGASIAEISIDVGYATVSAAGDFDGDGVDDFAVGDPGATFGNTSSGGAYIVYGDAVGPIDQMSLSTLDSLLVAKFSGGSFAESASGFRGLASAGDVNGDGYSDVLMSSYMKVGANGQSGIAYVGFGRDDYPSMFSASSLDGDNGFSFKKLNDSTASIGVTVAGDTDLNGDGYSDVSIGSASGAYVLFGHAGTFDADLQASEIDGTNGFLVTGGGTIVSQGGDFNGDGYDDLVISNSSKTINGATNAGAVYVVFGKSGGFGAAFDVSQLNGTNGFKIHGTESSRIGESVSLAGDFNADGYSDLLIGAPGININQTSCMILYGHSGSNAATVTYGAVDGFNGFMVKSNFFEQVGDSVSFADLNGDGFDELVVGSQEDEAYVIYGKDFLANAYVGTSAGETMTRGPDDEAIAAGQGNDIINGNGGADAINAGQGNDEIHVADNKFFRIDGGTGVDTLHLDYSGAIDFGNLDGNASTSDRGRIENVEVIDVSNGHANALTLHLADVLDIDATISDVGGIASLDNALRIDGEASDTLQLFSADGWSSADTTTLVGYAIYTYQAVKVAVDTDIDVTVI